VAAATPRGLATLSYEDHHGGTDAVLDWLSAKLSPRMLEAPAKLDDVRRELDEYFEGRRRDFDLPIDWTLTSEFTRRVLKATADIPFGELSTYGKVAAQAGNAKASRAAGRALGSNPIPIVVPCHRVVGTNGKLTGYTGGLHRKVALLQIEGVVLG
jgi:methylated-DNA-[protein]-cysteine S-methyltransferase